jgi:hypothetical protein
MVEINEREGAGSDFFINVVRYPLLVWFQFRPTSTPPLKTFSQIIASAQKTLIIIPLYFRIPKTNSFPEQGI